MLFLCINPVWKMWWHQVGTSLTIDQIKLIKRYTDNITILYDGDAAGIRASFRGIDMILEEGLNVKVVLCFQMETIRIRLQKSIRILNWKNTLQTVQKILLFSNRISSSKMQVVIL
jgi:hypothetical protein